MTWSCTRSRYETRTNTDDIAISIAFLLTSDHVVTHRLKPVEGDRHWLDAVQRPYVRLGYYLTRWLMVDVPRVLRLILCLHCRDRITVPRVLQVCSVLGRRNIRFGDVCERLDRFVHHLRLIELLHWFLLC